MKLAKISIIYLILLVFDSCAEDHLITNVDYRDLVEKTFGERRQTAKNRDKELFSVFDKGISVQQTEALKFLFAFMPLSDLADYEGEFFLANADMSIRAKKETTWGRQIPDDIFLHYVLPIRVNNENLDSFRIAYYDEIMSRVGTLSIKEAALEINHWCHEKVSYQPADIRTSAPMSTILSARGRCGEESTFTVAALRTAGIPARQVYTPRWAHSDDNHAWVEIWDNGEWFYMGACEPEPVLDRGWFTEPARRAMLIHTKSFGAPYGLENTINRFRYYSEVNNLGKYAVTKKIYVKVSDANGRPAENANVEYKLYNYAEFYPLALVPTDKNGISSFETGLGDLIIWASKDNEFDFLKVSVEESDTVRLKLGRIIENGTQLDLDLGVPVVRAPYPGISSNLTKENELRINSENLIRQDYISTWIQPEEIRTIAQNRSIDSSRLKSVFSRSMGNYNEIMSFISIVPDTLMEKALLMLEVLADKDLRDIKAVVLTDHLYYCILPSSCPDKSKYRDIIDYVLNPRIANEMIVPWRRYFRSVLPDQLAQKAPADPSLITKYLNENIVLADDENYYKTPLTPIGVNELKISDTWSRSICFVAICRSMGIPSRLEEGRLIPQYLQNGTWHDVYFSDQNPPSDKKGYVKFKSTESRPVPEYYIHFTLSRLEGGRYVTLAYDFNKKVTDFREDIALPPGKYMLLTGNRISDNRILTSITFFDLKENEHKDITISLRKSVKEKNLLGHLNTDEALKIFANNKELAPSIRKKGVVIIWIDPEKEPTKHIFNDLPLLKPELDRWGGYILFLNAKNGPAASFDPLSLKELPVNTLFGDDNELGFLNRTIDVKTLPDEKLPFVMVSDQDGNIVFTSAGYRIGIGEQILKYLQ
jgi:transglutaminase-like putative cysteine protease